MNGIVDLLGRALAPLSLRPHPGAEATDLHAWIDTAFNGELVIPSPIMQTMQLEPSAGIEAALADGTVALLESFTCLIDWLGQERTVEVIANDGAFPLLGIGLLIGHRLTVDYSGLTVSIE